MTATFALAVAAAGAPQPSPASRDDVIELAQFTFRSRITVRVQSAPVVSASHMEVHEKKGPRCLPSGVIVGAAVVASDKVDFVVRGGKRIRARLESKCPALDFYSGFYLSPGPDGQVCADRDVIRSRAGGECGIDRFRELVIKPAR